MPFFLRKSQHQLTAHQILQNPIAFYCWFQKRKFYIWAAGKMICLRKMPSPNSRVPYSLLWSSTNFCRMPTLPETNSLPLKIGRDPRRKLHLPNHWFLRLFVKEGNQPPSTIWAPMTVINKVVITSVYMDESKLAYFPGVISPPKKKWSFTTPPINWCFGGPLCSQTTSPYRYLWWPWCNHFSFASQFASLGCRPCLAAAKDIQLDLSPGNGAMFPKKCHVSPNKIAGLFLGIIS